MRKLGIPLLTPVLLYESGGSREVYITQACFRDPEFGALHLGPYLA